MDTKQTAINRAQLFLKDCQKLPIKIDKALIFGSVISGTDNDLSDIDLALFSDSFTDNILDNLDLIGWVNINYPELDVHTFPTVNLNQKGLLLTEILAHGIELPL